MLWYINSTTYYSLMHYHNYVDPIVPPCEEGFVRLVDGAVDQEGRVEVCINSVWGVVCDNQWDNTDAHVLCKQLGHPELGGKAIVIVTFVL